MAAAGQTSARLQRQRGARSSLVLLLDPLLLLLLLLLVASSCARGQGPEDLEPTTKGALTAEAVDVLVARFADLVARAAAAGGDDGEEGRGAAGVGVGVSASSSPSSPLSSSPPLDPGAESLLARLLDEVLPLSNGDGGRSNGDGDGDGADQRGALRKRTVGAMGIALPPQPSQSSLSPDAAPSQRRRRRLQQNATPLSPIIPPTNGLFTVNNGGRFGGYAQAFQIVFSNAFDFFLRGGLGFLVPIIGDTLAPLRRWNNVRDLGNAIDAPFDNVINANYIPLPQTTDDLVALALRLLAPVCAAEKATAGNKVLGAVRGAAAEVELVPWSCDVVPNDDDDEEEETEKDGGGGGDKHDAMKKKAWRARAMRLGGQQRIDWASCTPSKLVVRLKPATLNGPYYSAASYAAAACAFSQPFGLGSTVGLGLDSAAVALKLSRIGVDVVPTIVQFEGSGRFFPWLATVNANNGSAPPAREVAFTSASNRTTGARR